eukprot:GFUD01129483.1.p1 GENE.GFUD01129483.1~~GFUD01129483.1.p1  ORF type:complete len:177 (-),score=35.86 GFUD01129483.1:47-541(-)
MDCTVQHRSTNSRRCHSRNHHQQDLILDFLASLDKTKTFQWQSAVNTINNDWYKMMQTQPENAEEEASKDNPANKHVTWREDLLDIRTISPRQSRIFKAKQLNSSENADFPFQQVSGISNQEPCRHYLCSVGDGHHCRLKTKNTEHKKDPNTLHTFLPLINSNL